MGFVLIICYLFEWTVLLFGLGELAGVKKMGTNSFQSKMLGRIRNLEAVALTLIEVIKHWIAKAMNYIGRLLKYML